MFAVKFECDEEGKFKFERDEDEEFVGWCAKTYTSHVDLLNDTNCTEVVFVKTDSLLNSSVSDHVAQRLSI